MCITNLILMLMCYMAKSTNHKIPQLTFSFLVTSYLLCTNILLVTFSHTLNLCYIFTVAEQLTKPQQVKLQFCGNFNPLADAHVCWVPGCPGDKFL